MALVGIEVDRHLARGAAVSRAPDLYSDLLAAVWAVAFMRGPRSSVGWLFEIGDLRGWTGHFLGNQSTNLTLSSLLDRHHLRPSTHLPTVHHLPSTLRLIEHLLLPSTTLTIKNTPASATILRSSARVPVEVASRPGIKLTTWLHWDLHRPLELQINPEGRAMSAKTGRSLPF